MNRNGLVQMNKLTKCHFCGIMMFKSNLRKGISVCYSCKEKGMIMKISNMNGRNRIWKNIGDHYETG